MQTNVPLIHQVVVAQQAAARQGTHSTKTRGDVSGGGAKPWRQKGTGRARQGSRRSPQWAGGGVAHGPHPRSYAQRTPKKMIAAALRGALSDRARDGRVHVVERIVTGETPSTKAALLSLAAIGSAKLLVVLDRDEDVAWLSLRNVAAVHALAVDQLNAYDVLVSDDVVFTTAALAALRRWPAQGQGHADRGRATETESRGGREVSDLKIRDHRDILLAPVVSEKSYGLLDENKYTFLVAPTPTRPRSRSRSRPSSASR